MFTFSWKVTTSRLRTVRKCRLPGRQLELPAGVEQIPGRSGRQTALGDPGVRLFETSENGLDYFTAYRHASSRRTGNGVSRRTTTVWQR